jgi:hypothetical protein
MTFIDRWRRSLQCGGVDRRVPAEGAVSVGRSSRLTPDRLDREEAAGRVLTEKEVVARWIDRRRALGDIIWG